MFKTRPGTMMLSVISFLMIGGAFEAQRYVNFQERQALYHAIIGSFEHPERTVDATSLNVQDSTKSEPPSFKTAPDHLISAGLSELDQANF